MKTDSTKLSLAWGRYGIAAITLFAAGASFMGIDVSEKDQQSLFELISANIEKWGLLYAGLMALRSKWFEIRRSQGKLTGLLGKFGLVLLCATISACSTGFVNRPSICDIGSQDQAKRDYAQIRVENRKKWFAQNYNIVIPKQENDSLLCKVATEQNIHLEATGDLVMIIDLSIVRRNRKLRPKAVRLFEDLRNTFLAGARGLVLIKASDLAELARGQIFLYPELAIALRYIDLFDLPQYKDLPLKTLGLASLIYWCDENIRIIKMMK